MLQRGPALSLFVVAPIVAEFLLGNLSIDLLWLLVVLAPLYGTGALLAREMALRWGRGWFGRFALGLAFGLIEEGLITESLFDPSYLGLRLLDYGYVPLLGIGTWWTVFVLSLHSIWSICASIGLAESLWPEQRRARWLSDGYLPVTGLVFVAAGVATNWLSGKPASVATSFQIAGVVLLVWAVIVATAYGSWLATGSDDRHQAPRPRIVGGTSFVLLSIFMMSTWSMTSIPVTANVAWMLGVLTLLAWRLRRWSRRHGWDGRHELAATIGALATYAWWGLVLPATVSRVDEVVDTIGNVVVIAGVGMLVGVAHSRVRKRRETNVRGSC